MNHCVPDGEIDFADFDAFTPFIPNDFSAVKSKWVSMQHSKKSAHDDMAYVPDHDYADSTWADVPTSAPLFTESVPGKQMKQQWQAQGREECEWITANHTDGITPTVPVGAERNNGVLECIVNNLSDQNQLATNFKDDELESWLQYPLDDLDHNYGQDMWGDLPPPTSPPSKETVTNAAAALKQAGVLKQVGTTGYGSSVTNPQSMRAANAAAALALGAQRAAGLIPPSSDAFNKVRASSLPTITTSNVRWGSGAASKASMPTHLTVPSTYHVSDNDVPARDHRTSSAFPVSGGGPVTTCFPAKSSGLMDQDHQQEPQTIMAPPAPPARTMPLNFSHFSRPAAMYSRANLQNMGAALCGGTNVRVKMPDFAGAKTSSLSCNSSVADSTMMTSSMNTSMGASGILVELAKQEEKRASLEKAAVQGSMPGGGVNSLPKLGYSTARSGCVSQRGLAPAQIKTFEDGTEQGYASTITGSGPFGLEKRTGLLRRPSVEATVTSSCGGESSGRPGKDDIPSQGKAKRGREEETECSEDVVEDSGDAKKQGSARAATNAAKRSRAAEVHNLSERRRRDRINERMKALQELIPNSNKTDKASMLDEAIEYLKMLQLQLQVMSMRTGVGMNPMLPGQVPPGQGMPQLPIGNLHGLPPMPAGMSLDGLGGLGNMGMGLPGVPMGFSDQGTMPLSLQQQQHQRHLMDMSAFSQGPTPGHRPTSAAGLMDGAHPRQLNPSTMDPLGAYLARQQMHSQQSPVNLDVYQAYMLQQQNMGRSRQ